MHLKQGQQLDQLPIDNAFVEVLKPYVSICACIILQLFFPVILAIFLQKLLLRYYAAGLISEVPM
jgi:hypothetical protein